MMFDAMCRIAERHEFGFAPKLRYASLLRMPGVHQADMDLVIPDFRMIWKAMAIEDDQSCVFMERLGQIDRTFETHELTGHLGILDTGQELFNLVDRTKRNGTADVGLLSRDVFDVAILTKGEVGEVLASFMALFCGQTASGKVWSAASTFNVAVRCHGESHFIRKTVQPVTPHHTLFHAELQKDLFVAWTQCWKAARPGNWILKESVNPRNLRDPQRSPKIPRAHERPRWLLITDVERTRYFRQPAEVTVGANEHSPITPHPRRAHYRHIGENEDGSRRHTWVRACWVGSKEAEIHGSRYRVELEL